MRQLRIRTLAALFAIAAVLSWAGAGMMEALDSLPTVPVAAPIVLTAIAAVLLATALSLRSRLKAQRERQPGAKGVNPMMAARAVVFAQASALVGALASGMYGGMAVFLLLDDIDASARGDQALYAGLSVAAGAGVVAAAVLLERVCKLPEDEDDGPAASAA